MIFNVYTLQDRRTFPEESGVYAVTLNGECLYAGETCNLKKRWQSHKLIPVIRQNPQARILFSSATERQRKRAEEWLIRTFEPLYNDQVVEIYQNVTRAQRALVRVRAKRRQEIEGVPVKTPYSYHSISVQIAGLLGIRLTDEDYWNGDQDGCLRYYDESGNKCKFSDFGFYDMRKICAQRGWRIVIHPNEDISILCGGEEDVRSYFGEGHDIDKSVPMALLYALKGEQP